MTRTCTTTITQAKKQKRVLEKEIFDYIYEFEEDTGLSVDYVNIYRNPTLGNPNGDLISVNLDIKI